MKIITIYFERKKKFRKFKKVFIRSCKRFMPKTKCEIIQVPMPENIDHKRDTAYAFLAAAEYALKSGETLAICDVDLMFNKTILDADKLKFDIAITTRQSKMKYNTGLWFYRPTERSKQFVREWIYNTKRLMDNFCENEHFSWTHGGIDQASLHMTLLKNKSRAKIIELPCLEWNATQSEWKHMTPKVRVIHVKSKLAGACFGKDIPEGHEYMNYLIKKWKGFLK